MSRSSETLKPGYLYVLVHPSDPTLHKVGVTILPVEKRLAQHNAQLDKYAGKVVADTGQSWELRTFIAVPDVYWAERAFWESTPMAVVPFRGGVEVERMDWATVERGIAAAQKAGVRPPRAQKAVRDRDWLVATLDGTGIQLLGRYGGLVRGVEFQCEHGHVFKESPGLLANKKSCPCCVDWGFTRGYRAGLRASLK